MPNTPLNIPAQGHSQDALWQRLVHWGSDPSGTTPTLGRRLSLEHGWTTPHAERVLEEYRRFLWLAVRRYGAACPSDAVDKAWHTHLLHSQSYFEDFCPKVLGHTLHHFPNKGGDASNQLHRQRYADTLRHYAESFGEVPPPDIWPDGRVRFSSQARPVDTATHWALPKPTWFLRPIRSRAQRVGWLLALPALLFVGCVPVTIHPDWSGEQFLAYYLLCLMAWVGLGVALVWRPLPGQTRRGASTARLHELDLAYLASGSVRAVQTALARLLQQGLLERSDSAATWRSTPSAGKPTHPLEDVLYQQVAQGLQPGSGLGLFEARHELDRLHQGLFDRGLVSAPTRERRLRPTRDRVYLAGWVGLLGWGALRLLHGLQHGHPVGFLLLLMMLGLALGVVFSARLPHRLTRQGLAAIREARAALKRRDGWRLKDPQMPMALALMGAAALSPDLSDALQETRRNDAGASGCGSGCAGSDGGGGGDGGGCGGGGD